MSPVARGLYKCLVLSTLMQEAGGNLHFEDPDLLVVVYAQGHMCM